MAAVDLEVAVYQADDSQESIYSPNPYYGPQIIPVSVLAFEYNRMTGHACQWRCIESRRRALHELETADKGYDREKDMRHEEQFIRFTTHHI